MLDAPVSGGAQGAEDASLSIMVGGKTEVLEKVLHHQKGMGIVLESATQLGLDLPGAKQVSAYIDELVADGLGEIDSAALVKRLEAKNGIRIKPDK